MVATFHEIQQDPCIDVRTICTMPISIDAFWWVTLWVARITFEVAATCLWISTNHFLVFGVKYYDLGYDQTFLCRCLNRHWCRDCSFSSVYCFIWFIHLALSFVLSCFRLCRLFRPPCYSLFFDSLLGTFTAVLLAFWLRSRSRECSYLVYRRFLRVLDQVYYERHWRPMCLCPLQASMELVGQVYSEPCWEAAQTLVFQSCSFNCCLIIVNLASAYWTMRN